MPTAVSDVAPSRSTDELIRSLASSGGFTAPKVAEGVGILEAMCRDGACTRFLSFPVNIVATGTRNMF